MGQEEEAEATAATTRAGATEEKRGSPALFSVSASVILPKNCTCANESTFLSRCKDENSKGFFERRRILVFHFLVFFFLSFQSSLLQFRCLRVAGAPGLFLQPIAIEVAGESVVAAPSAMAGDMIAAAAGAGSEVSIETDETGDEGDLLLLEELARIPPPQQRRRRRPRRRRPRRPAAPRQRRPS